MKVPQNVPAAIFDVRRHNYEDIKAALAEIGDGQIYCIGEPLCWAEEDFIIIKAPAKIANYIANAFAGDDIQDFTLPVLDRMLTVPSIKPNTKHLRFVNISDLLPTDSKAYNIRDNWFEEGDLGLIREI